MKNSLPIFRRKNLFVKTAIALLLLSGFFISGAHEVYASPSAVTDLRVDSAGFRHVVLKWTAPYDTDASTPAVYYEIRVSSYRVIVDENDWANNSTSTSYPYRIKFSTITNAGVIETKTISSLVNGRTYFFAIKSSTDDINWSSLDTASPEPQGTPTNSNPGNVIGYNYTGTPTTVVFTTTPVLTWSAVTNAGNLGTDNLYGDSIASYTLWYSTISNFSVKFVADGITNTSYTALPLSENTTYYWRVYAVDSEGLLSPGVVGVPQFVINAASEPPNAPSLIQPIDDNIETGTKQPAFWWSAAADPDPADYVVYDLYISTSASFETEITTITTGINNTFWSPSWELTENYRYYWKVKARDTTGLITPSLTETFRVNTAPEDPGLFDTFYPVSGVKVFTSSPTLSWTPSYDPDPGDSVVYDLKISSSDPSLNDFPQVLSINATFYKVEGLMEDAIYWWRVIARDTTNRTTLSVSISSFTVNEYNFPPSAFSLNYSSGILRTPAPVFSWEPATDPDGDNVYYEIKISSRADFSFYHSSSGLTLTGYTAPPAVLAENNTYYWQVSAYDDWGLMRFSATWYLIINAVDENPSDFALLSPSDGEIIATLKPQLNWEASSDPDPYDFVDHYTLEYSTNETLTPSVVLNLATTYYIFPSQLLNNTTYWWRVVAVSTLTGTTSSLIKKFITGNAPPAEFSVIYPTGIIRTSTPTFVWQLAPDPQGEEVYYDLYISTDSYFQTVQFSSLSITSTYYSIVTPLAENGNYFWKVRARNQTGSARYSEQTLNFSVNAVEENPLAFSLVSPSPTENAVTDTLVPIFVWGASSDPDPGDSVVYDLWYSPGDPDFSEAKRVIVSSISATEYQIPAILSLQQESTYYWRVYARDTTGRLTASSSDGKFYINPSVRPLPPSNFDITFSLENKTATLSWEAPTKNDDGSDLSGISHYLIYVSYDYDAIFETAPSTYVPSGLRSCVVSPVYSGAYFGIKTVNSNGVKSILSKVIKAESASSSVLIFRHTDGDVIVEGSREVLSSTANLTIIPEELPAGDTRTTYAFRITCDGINGEFLKPLTLKVRSSYFRNSSVKKSFRAAVADLQEEEEAIYWFNGVEWISLGGSLDDKNYLNVKITSAGSYRMRAVSRSATFRIMNVWPRVFTPNADGTNDEFNVTFENPYSADVEGWIYDISGYRIGRMTLKTDSWIVWDGKDERGTVVPSGIYIYQIKTPETTKNGTVVVAR